MSEPYQSYNETLVTLGALAVFLAFDESNLNFTITGENLTSDFVGDHQINIEFKLTDGGSILQKQLLRVESKEEEYSEFNSGIQIELSPTEIEAYTPIVIQMTSVDVSGKFSILFSRPVQLDMNYIETERLAREQTNESRRL